MRAEKKAAPAAAIDIDLAEWPPELDAPPLHGRVLALIRWAETPLGTLDLDLDGETLTPALVWERANEQMGGPLLEAITRHVLQPAGAEGPESPLPSATVLICTRDRPEDLHRCLESVRAHSTSPIDILVVDNAPAKAPAEATARKFDARCVLEPRSGLNWARQCGANAASSDIVIYIDDDVVVTPGWDAALLSCFDDPEVAGAAGLVLPFEVRTPAQLLFEELGGFSRGYERREHSLESGTPLGAARVGAGACMAFRRELVTDLGLFAVELDAGTPTQSGGDTYAFYRLLSLGHLLVYEPRAIIRHKHRTSIGELRRTLHGYSVGTYCFLFRCFFQHGEFFAPVVGLRWLLDHHLPQLVRGLMRRSGAQPLSLTISEIGGVLLSPFAYLHASVRERRVG